MKIGFFDSGIGGLSVLHNALSKLPNEQFLYYADTKHVPYGEKTKQEILTYVSAAIEFMIQQEVKAIVIACNTATSVAINELRAKYTIPIIGMEPAVKKAIDAYGDQRVLVTATPITVRGDKMHSLIENVDKKHLVDLVPLPKLVRFAENGIFNSDEVIAYLAAELGHYELSEYSSLVLGCTHFNYFKESFRQVLPSSVHFVDGIDGTVTQLIQRLQETNQLEHNQRNIEFYQSGIKVTDQKELEHIHKLFEQLERMAKLA